jgi:hypothetical protein
MEAPVESWTEASEQQNNQIKDRGVIEYERKMCNETGGDEATSIVTLATGCITMQRDAIQQD